jgi:hypothetical protein
MQSHHFGSNGGDQFKQIGEEPGGRLCRIPLLLTERRAVVSSRGASVRLWGRGDSPRQDREGVTETWVSVQEGRL